MGGDVIIGDARNAIKEYNDNYAAGGEMDYPLWAGELLVGEVAPQATVEPLTDVTYYNTQAFNKIIDTFIVPGGAHFEYDSDMRQMRVTPLATSPTSNYCSNSNGSFDTSKAEAQKCTDGGDCG